jgi:hypothetical protein
VALKYDWMNESNREKRGGENSFLFLSGFFGRTNGKMTKLCVVVEISDYFKKKIFLIDDLSEF